MALPSINTGSNACIPNLCSVGARFNKIGCSRITCSKMSQTSGVSASTERLAALMVDTKPSFSNRPKINGLNNSKAIFLGRPHWCNLNVGPTTITERPE